MHAYNIVCSAGKGGRSGRCALTGMESGRGVCWKASDLAVKSMQSSSRPTCSYQSCSHYLREARCQGPGRQMYLILSYDAGRPGVQEKKGGATPAATFLKPCWRPCRNRGPPLNRATLSSAFYAQSIILYSTSATLRTSSTLWQTSRRDSSLSTCRYHCSWARETWERVEEHKVTSADFWQY